MAYSSRSPLLSCSVLHPLVLFYPQSSPPMQSATWQVCRSTSVNKGRFLRIATWLSIESGNWLPLHVGLKPWDSVGFNWCWEMAQNSLDCNHVCHISDLTYLLLIFLFSGTSWCCGLLFAPAPKPRTDKWHAGFHGHQPWDLEGSCMVSSSLHVVVHPLNYYW